ncbi:MAG TPA: lipopolysaccharide core heptose(I) kinase RfaP [Candidatus Acidoferrum sp.]|nr:lipopolysaccharide core heptose(I) kinase RfaP [Candidatus Acidoferrum sp.]
MELYLRDDIGQLWQGQDAFAAARQIRGTTFRQLERRQTLAFTDARHRYFIKRHHGVSWKEIFKNLLQLRLPVTSARNEFDAIQRLQRLGIKVPSVAAYGRRGLLPSSLESFLVTDDVGEHTSLEQHCRHWAVHKPEFRHKQELLRRIADIARTMHEAGVCHRDFYLCHLLLTDKGDSLTVIDLHRALVKPALGRRWIVKDLASLYFSAMECGLTQRDLLRFIRQYRQEPLRRILRKEAWLWQLIASRAARLYRRHPCHRHKSAWLAY